VQTRPLQSARAVLRGREAAAMVATARWAYRTAIARTETRGMHKHMDFPTLDPAQQRRLITSGLDQVTVRPEKSAPSQGVTVANESASVASATA